MKTKETATTTKKNKELGAGLSADLKKQLAPAKGKKTASNESSNVKIVMSRTGAKKSATAEKSEVKKAATKKTTKAGTAPKKTTAAKEKSTAAKTPAKRNTQITISKPKKSSIVSDGEFFSLKTEKVGKFEIKKSKDGRYVFNLYAVNHNIVATSQVYSSSAAALAGIRSVITNAVTAPIEDQTLKNYEVLTYPKWEIYKDNGNGYRFRLNASNGNCICHSQGYTTKASCKNGIDSIMKLASDADIKKQYLEKK